MSEASIQTNGPPGPLHRTGVPVVDHILTPGSSLTSPTFTLVLDLAFICLFLVLFGLFTLTKSIHFAVLIVIELGLWASVKW
jgi:ER protein Pkr1